MINPLEYQFNYVINNFGHNVIINNSNQVKVLLKEYNELNNMKEYKFMLVKNGLVKQGDIVKIFDDNWIVIHEDVSVNDVYTKVVIRRLKFNIKFNFTGEIIPISASIDEGTMRLDEGIITLPDGKVILHMQENETSKRIEKGQRFIIMNNVWKVIQKTNAEHGLYKIYCDIDSFNGENDDKENEIADRWKFETKDNYTIKINNTENTINLDSTLQLDVTTTNNNKIVTVPLTYTSSNTNILTVFDTGLITRVDVGNATITVAITDNTDIKDTIEITTEEPEQPTEPTENYTIELENNYESLVFGLPVEFTATVYQNGQQVDKQVKFEIIRNPHLAWIEIDENNSNKCCIYGNKENNTGDVTLRVSLIDDESVYIERDYTVGSW